ncbi:MAG: CHRD domain-containing protein [Alphaproteobacteria bacterium]|nr:CHRD domain-containing protein [Alphaproteobacteria bacterium]
MKFRSAATFAIAVAAIGLVAGPSGAVPITYRAILDGPSESPPNSSLGTGTAIIVLDSDTNFLSISASFAGLSAPTTVAHIHCCTAIPLTATVGVAVTPTTLPGFPAGVTAGTYDIAFSPLVVANFTGGFLSTFGGGTVDGAVDALEAAFNSGRAYFNVHTTTSPGGEIRGFIAPVPVPATALLFGAALTTLGLTRYRRRSEAAA